jgi:hypothetical protein
MFYDGMDTLAKIKLGWFASNKDKSELDQAKGLARRGYNICHDLKNVVHNGLKNFKIEDYKLVKTAL